MFSKVFSAHLLGITGVGVDVEADVSSRGLPSFSVVGLAEGALRESKERVRSSLKNLDYNIFARPITINLAPADFKKEGSHFDLAIALGLLAAAEIINKEQIHDSLFLGELSLDGGLRGVAGVLSMAEYAKTAGFKKIIVPYENKDEAALISGIHVYPFENLGEVIGFLRGEINREPYKRTNELDCKEITPFECDFSDVKGQFAVKRGAEIAAAGMHNMIMIGSPGSGKTMIAKRLPSILPSMSEGEALETTKIYSAAGLIKHAGNLISIRPFVSPHHTASNIAIIGGGAKAKPGHVSIASGGVLFLDEMLEFNRNVLEVLRQPLEDREVTIARAGKTITYPAKFMLIGAMNPCPCGYYGDKIRECSCTVPMIEKYRNRLSGPMLDRIDLRINVASVPYSDLINMDTGETSASIRERVINAHKIQSERFRDFGIIFNSQMGEKHIREFCKTDEKGLSILESAMKKYSLSARAYGKILKTSRTVADLAESPSITSNHILEALQLKIPDRD